MNRFVKHLGVAAAVALSAGGTVSACAKNNASIFIRQVFAPVIPTNGLCLYTADVTQGAISGGTVDLSFASLSTYTPTVLIGNQIVSQANANSLQAETSRVIINGGITRITDLNGNTSLCPMFDAMCKANDEAACNITQRLAGCPHPGSTATPALSQPVDPFSTVESTAIEPASGTSAAYGALALTLVDSATVAILRAYFEESVLLNGPAAFTSSIQLLTYTQVVGQDLGNDTVESNEFEFPVTFVYGGLVTNLASDAVFKVGYCIDTSFTVPTTAQVCVSGQDAPAIVSPGAIPDVPTCPKGDAGATAIVEGSDAGGT